MVAKSVLVDLCNGNGLVWRAKCALSSSLRRTNPNFKFCTKYIIQKIVPTLDFVTKVKMWIIVYQNHLFCKKTIYGRLGVP